MSSIYIDELYPTGEGFGFETSAIGGAVGTGARRAATPTRPVATAVRSGAQQASRNVRSPSSSGGGTGSAVRKGAQQASRKVAPKPAKQLNTAAKSVAPAVRTPVQTTTANQQFGSFNISSLRSQPAGTYAAEVTKAAAARQYANLQLLQRTEGQALAGQLQTTQAKARRIQELTRANNGNPPKEAIALYNELRTDAAKTLELHKKWKASFNGAAYAKNPEGFLANPIKNAHAQELVDGIEKGVNVGTGLANKNPLGPLLGPVTETIGDLATGAVTGHPPDPVGLAGNFTESLKKTVANPPVPPTMDIINEMVQDADVAQMFGLSPTAGVY